MTYNYKSKHNKVSTIHCNKTSCPKQLDFSKYQIYNRHLVNCVRFDDLQIKTKKCQDRYCFFSIKDGSNKMCSYFDQNIWFCWVFFIIVAFVLLDIATILTFFENLLEQNTILITRGPLDSFTSPDKGKVHLLILLRSSAYFYLH